MATHALAVDSGRMDPILIYCRPRDNCRGHTLRAWLEHQAAELSPGPEVRHIAIIRLTTPGPGSPHDLGFLLECQLANADGACADMLRDLVTDMRLVGLEPVVFVAQPRSR